MPKRSSQALQSKLHPSVDKNTFGDDEITQLKQWQRSQLGGKVVDERLASGLTPRAQDFSSLGDAVYSPKHFRF
jgi:hypothetical protein